MKLNLLESIQAKHNVNHHLLTCSPNHTFLKTHFFIFFCRPLKGVESNFYSLENIYFFSAWMTIH